MQIGDLVEIQKWCMNKGRRGIVTEVPEYLNCVKLIYLDTAETTTAMIDNLILLSSVDNSLT